MSETEEKKEETVEETKVEETATEEKKEETKTEAKNDNNENLVMGILAYIGLLVLVPIFAAKDSKFARFHANQGLILLIIEVACSVVFGILGMIPYVGIIFSILGGAVGVICLILSIIGIVNVCKNKTEELPYIGKFTILK